MAWQDRVQEAAYTPPVSGERLTFDFEDVREVTELRGARYDFVDANGSYIQPTGTSGRRFPLRVFLTGSDYDLAATSFIAALREAGTGLLEHPIYGAVDVVPLGEVSRRDDLKTAGNQAIIEVVFWETIGALYPSGDADPASQVLQAVSEFNNAANGEFADSVDTTTKTREVSLASKVQNTIATVRTATQTVASSTNAVANEVNDIFDSVNTSIDTLVGRPLALAAQISQLIQSPGRAAALWSDKLTAYRALADGIFTNTYGESTARSRNNFRTDDLAASNALAGAITGAVNSQFETQPEALEAAQSILTLSDDLNTWREASHTALELTDTGGAYQQWQEAAALAAGFLIEISFTLAQERTVTLDRQRTIVDLCAELYGSVDDRLDFFIASNGLTGDDIIELQVGKQIRYYV